MNGAIGTVLAIRSSSHVTDNIEEPYVLKNFYIHRQQCPLILTYAVAIHKSQGLSLDCAIIDLSSQVFGESMAYVVLSSSVPLSWPMLLTVVSLISPAKCLEKAWLMWHFLCEITIRCATQNLFTKIHNGIQNVCGGGTQTQTKVQTKVQT